MKSIKQLANDLQISRSSVEARMNKIPNFRKKYTHKHQNRVLINQEGCRLISKGRESLTVPGRQTSVSQDLGSIIRTQNQTIQRLTNLLNQLQRLEFSFETENKSLRNRIAKLSNHNRYPNQKVVPLHHLSSSQPTRKSHLRKKLSSFWRQFFGK